MDIQRIYQFAGKQSIPESSEIEELKGLIDKYPYFQTAIFAYLKAIYISENDSFEEELRAQSIFINDRRALFYYIFSEEYDLFFENTGKKELPEDKTSVLLDAFFQSKGEAYAETGLEYSIIHSSLATTDYFSYLQSSPQEETGNEVSGKDPVQSSLKHQDIIDSFINKTETEGEIRIQFDTNTVNIPPVEQETNENGDELNEDVFFTETLAKIYIRQKKYEKAYKIIKHLSLNYPKKNIYFADQLSFLEKLIINSKYKNIK
ncbi:hypothetical protein GGR21_003688 [Dysgonomonas hofstadii]|uniref:Tetratricopeptide repeat protein n=1 Tax=Dysgonomonas hofstadii TaxID=637886 RepID=A0A840CNU0_9BACT|nr:hypothetical protein [Dysgonomonas hofstadii]MBB4037767.1 hypothetical protein [Dysgonomonas hofstadii]